MNYKSILFIGFCLAACMVKGETIDVINYKYAGPYEVKSPFMADSTDVNSKTFDSTDFIDYSIGLDVLNEGKLMSGNKLPGDSKCEALHLIGFNLDNSAYTDATISIKGVHQYQLYVDGKKMMSDYVKLEPSSHQVIVKYLSVPGKSDSMHISIECDKVDVIKLSDASSMHKYNFSDVIHGTHFNKASISPDGKYLIVGYQTVVQGGKTTQKFRVVEITSGKILNERSAGISWMPKSNKYYFVDETVDGRELIAVEPLSGKQTVLAKNVPLGQFRLSPTEDFLIYDIISDGPKEDADIYEVTEPDDRHPGWRNRINLSKFDIKTGVMQPLTYGHNNIIYQDISEDGKQLLFIKSESHLESRPTTVFSLYRLNLETLQTELLIEKDGFIDAACFSPDASQVLISGSPECLGGIGKNVREGLTPSMIDKQLYLMLSPSKIIPLTKNFDPSVNNAIWNNNDGMIYFTAEDKDSVNLFRLNPKTYIIDKVSCNEEMVMGLSFANHAPLMALYGMSASNSDRLYTMNLKTKKSTLLEDLSKETLKNAKLGECKAWTFKNADGETIYARYYLPADFDTLKKYPMIVNYYGGCSPTSRNFESRYPQHAYASLGYVVLVINPSGATGFGQDFSARHVNTAGEGVAQDIIEGTKQFCKEHPYVNKNKIGCIGASYGGFMTQYLQTVTDIFAAAISHAGISDHTSYWGEGYWGYSYSETSMANSYPWTDKHLYVDQSPLYNADKVHTPILFLHGDADTNVPVGESIQMYTALKLLGRETAMVLVKDQDHHIIDYQKRIKWQNTIFAWFAKYLQDDDSWWNSMYSKKNL